MRLRHLIWLVKWSDRLLVQPLHPSAEASPRACTVRRSRHTASQAPCQIGLKGGEAVASPCTHALAGRTRRSGCSMDGEYPAPAVVHRDNTFIERLWRSPHMRLGVYLRDDLTDMGISATAAAASWGEWSRLFSRITREHRACGETRMPRQTPKPSPDLAVSLALGRGIASKAFWPRWPPAEPRPRYEALTESSGALRIGGATSAVACCRAFR